MTKSWYSWLTSLYDFWQFQKSHFVICLLYGGDRLMTKGVCSWKKSWCSAWLMALIICIELVRHVKKPVNYIPSFVQSFISLSIPFLNFSNTFFCLFRIKLQTRSHKYEISLQGLFRFFTFSHYILCLLRQFQERVKLFTAFQVSILLTCLEDCLGTSG